MFGSPLDKILIIAVLTSAAASTQTTILPTARTTLSMARKRAWPRRFADVHPRYLTPSYSTLWMGAVSIVWTLIIMGFNPSQNVLGDSISALGFAICFYYGFTGLACVVYFRREITKSVRGFLLAGVAPLLGFVMLAYIAGKAFHDYSQEGFNYSPPFLGIEVPIAIGIGGLLLGFVAMLFAMAPYREYFRRKPYIESPSRGCWTSRSSTPPAAASAESPRTGDRRPVRPPRGCAISSRERNSPLPLPPPFCQRKSRNRPSPQTT